MVACTGTEHPYQVDRIWQVELAKLGMVVYEPSVSTYIRSHDEAGTWFYSRDERKAEFLKCTAMIGKLCAMRGLDLVALWQAYLRGLEDPVIEEVGRLFRIAFEEGELHSLGFGQLILPNPLMRMVKRIRTIARNRWKLYRPYKSIGFARRRAGR
jgi:hypothetical protein